MLFCCFTTMSEMFSLAWNDEVRNLCAANALHFQSKPIPFVACESDSRRDIFNVPLRQNISIPCTMELTSVYKVFDKNLNSQNANLIPQNANLIP